MRQRRKGTPGDMNQLRELESFAGLSEGAAGTLGELTTARSFGAGEALFQEGREAQGIFVILEGEARVVRTSRGRRHVLHTERRGGTLGEAPVFDRRPYPATAIAGTAVDALYIDRAAIDRAIRINPEIAWFFLARLAGRVRMLLGRVDGLATAQVSTRLCAYLLERAEQSGERVVAITQEALAEELGTVRDVVVRTLRALRERGIVSAAGRGRIRIVDLDALRESALSEL